MPHSYDPSAAKKANKKRDSPAAERTCLGVYTQRACTTLNLLSWRELCHALEPVRCLTTYLFLKFWAGIKNRRLVPPMSCVWLGGPSHVPLPLALHTKVCKWFVSVHSGLRPTPLKHHLSIALDSCLLSKGRLYGSPSTMLSQQTTLGDWLLAPSHLVGFEIWTSIMPGLIWHTNYFTTVTLKNNVYAEAICELSLSLHFVI